VPYGKEILLTPGFSYNPQTAEYKMVDDLEIVE
jgi:hypothetical protein